MSSFARELIREANSSSASQGPSFVPRASSSTNSRRREAPSNLTTTNNDNEQQQQQQQQQQPITIATTTQDSTAQSHSPVSTNHLDQSMYHQFDEEESGQHEAVPPEQQDHLTSLIEEGEQQEQLEPTETKSSRKRRRAAQSGEHQPSSSQNDAESTPLKRLRRGSAKNKKTIETDDNDAGGGDDDDDGYLGDGTFEDTDQDFKPRTRARKHSETARSSSSSGSSSTVRRRVDPSMKLTISDYLHDTKSGKPTRAARRKMRQQEKQQRKKKRERLRAKGVQVETSDEEDNYDSDGNTNGNNNNIQYDMYGNVISGDSISGDDHYGSEHIIHDGQSYNYDYADGDDDFGANEQAFTNTYDDFDAPPPLPPQTTVSSANSGSDTTSNNRLTGIAAQYAAEDEKDKDDMELTDMYLEEDDDEEGQLDNAGASNEDGMDSVPQIQFDENGQVILNQSSVTVTRNRGEAVDYGQYERVTETYGSKHITQATYARRQQKTKKWTKEETYQLFDAIQQFGTDFSMIVRLFPTRSRREVRNKFKKEEREKNPRLLEALKNRKPINIEMFKKLSAERDKAQGVVRRTRSAVAAEATADREQLSSTTEGASTNDNNNNGGGGGNADEDSQWEGGALEDEAVVDDNGEYEMTGQDGEAPYYSYDPYLDNYGGGEEESADHHGVSGNQYKYETGEVYNEEYSEYGS